MPVDRCFSGSTFAGWRVEPGMHRNTPIRRRVQAGVLCEVLSKMLPEECPNKAELLLLLAKLPSEGERQESYVRTGSCVASSGYRQASFKTRASVIRCCGVGRSIAPCIFFYLLFKRSSKPYWHIAADSRQTRYVVPKSFKHLCCKRQDLWNAPHTRGEKIPSPPFILVYRES